MSERKRAGEGAREVGRRCNTAVKECVCGGKRGVGRHCRHDTRYRHSGKQVVVRAGERGERKLRQNQRETAHDRKGIEVFGRDRVRRRCVCCPECELKSAAITIKIDCRAQEDLVDGCDGAVVSKRVVCKWMALIAKQGE